jgi:hypothetical protein
MQTLAAMPKPPRFAPTPVRVVELLAFPLVQLLDVTGPFQVFASANDLVLESGGRPPYALQVVARSGAQVTASSGLKLSTAPLPLAGAAVDTMIVAGGQGVEAAAADPAIIHWVQARESVRAASPPSAPAHFSWPRPVCSMGAEPLPIGRIAPSLPDASPKCASNPIQSSYTMGPSGVRQG